MTDKARAPLEAVKTPSATPPVRTEAAKGPGLDGGRVAGSTAPSIVHEVLRSSGQPLDAGARAFMEPRFGFDFGKVRVHSDARAGESAQAVRAHAYTVGSDLVFAPGRYAPATSAGRKLLAHELAHVVQQHEGRSPAGAAQHFAPEGHQLSVTIGLGRTGEQPEGFSAEEVGEIYRHNWERDFSQGSGLFADVVLAWHQLLASADDPARLAAAAKELRTQLARLLAVTDYEKEIRQKESLGGYRSWEHLDQPEDDDSAKRWKGATAKLAPYLLDGRAYIKEQLIQAVRIYRDGAHLGQVATGAGTAWSRGDGTEAPRPAGFGRDTEIATKTTLGTEVIAQGTAAAAVRDRGVQRGGAVSPAFAAAADPLGRATHGIEDFFAHSNWLELARRLKGGGAVSPGMLYTGKFGAFDKLHAFGFKMVAMAKAVRHGMELLLRAFSMRPPKTDYGVVGALAKRGNTTGGSVYGFYDVIEAAELMRKHVQSGGARVEDFVTSVTLLSQLEAKGHDISAQARAGSSDKDQAHRFVAKDQPDEGGSAAYYGALRLAVEADRLIVLPVRAAMTGKDAKAADAKLGAVLTKVDQVLDAPSTSHPLLKYVDAK